MEVKQKSSVEKTTGGRKEKKSMSFDDWAVMNCQDRWRMAWWIVLAIAELGYFIFMAACSVIVAISQMVFVIYTVGWILVSILVLYEVKWIGKSQVRRLMFKQGRLTRGKAGERSEQD